jgi:cytochrome c biogenesis protein ResB
MQDYSWIYQLSAGGALILFFYLLLRFVLIKLSTTLCELERTLEEINKAMANRDQIILNHLDHFQEAQERIIRLLEKVCEEWGIKNGRV